ncbi:hypothetical protein F0562_014157 [Nyssa sinensis]|uniref:Uncharacterized protein n=1 Tax=Nyssa sinensis TaxID=561372 RepID=A0A5J4ZM46_9ASTE|nr:hypothetical protein F0562_014157 [Nyssa sinensis]
MACYSSKYYEDDVGEYHQTPYSSSHDIVPTQDSISFFRYEFSQPKFIEYDPSDYGDAYDPHVSQSEISYSVYNFSVPKFVEYNPTPHAETQYIVSYSTLEFNEPDFEEYDLTPYGGGYDIAQTYGKPLPPSDEICHPRSMSEPTGLYQKDDIDGNGNQPAKAIEEEQQFHGGGGEQPTKAIEEEQQFHGGGGDQPTKAIEEEQQFHDGSGERLNNGYDSSHGGQLEKPSDSIKGEETEGYTSDDNYPWCGYDYGVGNRSSEDYGYGHGYDNQVPQPPYGYGSDVLDFCESIFGHWPCLSRKDWKSCGGQEVASEESKDNLWKSAGDYLFGRPFRNSKIGIRVI